MKKKIFISLLIVSFFNYVVRKCFARLHLFSPRNLVLKESCLRIFLFLVTLSCWPSLTCLGQQGNEKDYTVSNVQLATVKNPVLFNFPGSQTYQMNRGWTPSRDSSEFQSRESIQYPDTNKLSKLSVYGEQMKKPGIAVLWSLLISSAGHAYAGNWPRGLLFTAAKIPFAIMWVNGSKTYLNLFTGESRTETSDGFYIGLFVLIGLTIAEAIDAAGEANRYNDQLYERLTGQKRLGLNFIPSQNGLQMQVTFNF